MPPLHSFSPLCFGCSPLVLYRDLALGSQIRGPTLLPSGVVDILGYKLSGESWLNSSRRQAGRDVSRAPSCVSKVLSRSTNRLRAGQTRCSERCSFRPQRRWLINIPRSISDKRPRLPSLASYSFVRLPVPDEGSEVDCGGFLTKRI